MKKKIYVRGPFLTQSGYGEQSRFALKALQTKEDLFDIYLEPINWGQTGWIWNLDNEFRKWMDDKINQTILMKQQGTLIPDISLQIGIPNEWQRLAPINIGYTAGIETSHVSPQWLVKGNEMDKILVVSEHAKATYVNTTASQRGPDGNIVEGTPEVKLNTPITVVHERTDIEDAKPKKIDNFNPETDFNFLIVGQHGPRKNLTNAIRWWIEEFIDQDVGLVAKVSSINCSYMDSLKTYNDIRLMIEDYSDRKCKVYLLHGDLTEGQMSWLYQHDKIKALINISHGEGFGLPLYEAAALGLPVVSVGWSGQCDFLIHPETPNLYTDVKYNLQPIDEKVVWEGVLEKGTYWAYADQGSYKMGLRNVKNNWNKVKKDAVKLQKLINAKFNKETLYENFCNAIHEPDPEYLEWIRALEEADDL